MTPGLWCRGRPQLTGAGKWSLFCTEGRVKRIWTIGHSTRSLQEFLDLLRPQGIRALADVRLHPGSRRYPHFNREELARQLTEAGVAYHHFPELGGRRKPRPDSPNSAWRHTAFRGYADYMETEAFQSALHQLETLAAETPLAYMCSEAVWWSCHRSLISDALKVRGWTVLHILSETKLTEHPYTSPARVVNGALRYDGGAQLFS